MDRSGDDLRHASDLVERLLDEVRAMSSPLAWQRVELLVHTLVQLYGRGLAQVLAAVEACGALDDRLGARLAEDELVATLLALHGLHPLAPEARVRRALEQSGAERAGVELVAIEQIEQGEQGDGGGALARFRVVGVPAVVVAGYAGLVQRLEALVQEVVPEIGRIEIEGLPQRPEEALVQIDLSRSRARGAR